MIMEFYRTTSTYRVAAGRTLRFYKLQAEMRSHVVDVVTCYPDGTCDIIAKQPIEFKRGEVLGIPQIPPEDFTKAMKDSLNNSFSLFVNLEKIDPEQPESAHEPPLKKGTRAA